VSNAEKLLRELENECDDGIEFLDLEALLLEGGYVRRDDTKNQTRIYHKKNHAALTFSINTHYISPQRARDLLGFIRVALRKDGVIK